MYALPDKDVGLYLNSKRFDALYLPLHNLLLWESELRDAIYQHSSGFMQALKDCYVIAHLGKVAGAGKSAWAAANNGNAF